MRLLYAVQFEILPRGTETSSDVATGVLRALQGWVADRYLTTYSQKIDFSGRSELLTPLPSHEIEFSTESGMAPEATYSVLRWTYPDLRDGNLLWHTRASLATFDGMVEFSLEVLIESIQFYIAPVDYALGRPRIVATLLNSFTCTYGDTRLHTEPTALTATTISDFVVRRLLSRRRRLPIVIVSRSNISGRSLVDSLELSNKLAGIAEVYEFVDRWAAFEFSDQIGRPFSCYNGAVRLYWPDFVPSRSPYSPIYMPDSLAVREGQLATKLFQWLSAISAFRFVPGPVTMDAMTAVSDRKTQQLEELKTAAKERGDIEELFQLAEQERGDLQQQLNQKLEENRELRQRLEVSEANLQAMWKFEEPPLSDDATSEQVQDDEPEDVIAAVRIASKQLARLKFQDSAFAAAEESPFKQPAKVLQALQAMDEVCGVWISSLSTKQSIGSLEAQFAQRGFIYKAKESEITKAKWGNEYEMIYNGAKVSIEQHIALGKGGPDTCLRIHFYADPESHSFVVAHVGRHKTNTKTN